MLQRQIDGSSDRGNATPEVSGYAGEPQPQVVQRQADGSSDRGNATPEVSGNGGDTAPDVAKHAGEPQPHVLERQADGSDHSGKATPEVSGNGGEPQPDVLERQADGSGHSGGATPQVAGRDSEPQPQAKDAPIPAAAPPGCREEPLRGVAVGPVITDAAMPSMLRVIIGALRGPRVCSFFLISGMLWLHRGLCGRACFHTHTAGSNVWADAHAHPYSDTRARIVRAIATAVRLR